MARFSKLEILATREAPEGRAIDQLFECLIIQHGLHSIGIFKRFWKDMLSRIAIPISNLRMPRQAERTSAYLCCRSIFEMYRGSQIESGLGIIMLNMRAANVR